jgi:GNAT superfamily N-acetyltransferase
MDRSANIVGNEAGARLFTGTLIPWARIVASHALLGQQGLSHYNDRNGIEVLMYRSRGGYLEGVLRRSTSGELSVYVDPRRQHRGIGTILVREAARRWGVDLSVQRFTPSGLALAQKALPVDRNIGDPAWMKNPS